MQTLTVPRRATALLLLCLPLAALRGQVAPAMPAAAAAAPRAEDAVQLTPFTVNTDRDTGFAAASALAGGRLATDLRDTPAAYSVINREFIEALNLTDLMDAQNWSPGATFQSDIGTFNFTTFTVRYTSRGVGANSSSAISSR